MGIGPNIRTQSALKKHFNAQIVPSTRRRLNSFDVQSMRKRYTVYVYFRDKGPHLQLATYEGRREHFFVKDLAQGDPELEKKIWWCLCLRIEKPPLNFRVITPEVEALADIFTAKFPRWAPENNVIPKFRQIRW